MPRADGHALNTAVAVAAAHGVTATDPVILRDQLNVLIHLRPAPVVARVAGTIARVRPGADWLRRELAVASFLSRAGAPVVAPSDELPPGPHEHDGRVVSFWEYVPEADEPVDRAAAGAALRECHEALREYHGSLPVLLAITEAEAILTRMAAEEAVSSLEAARLLERIHELSDVLGSLRSPVQPLHGDAQLDNVLNSPRGPLWNDWEDTCIGPIGWDAACLLNSAQGRERAEAALAASGIRVDRAEMSLWREARELQLAVWRAFLSSSPALPRR